jgi:uncharacterized protein (DUF362 family)
MTPTVAVVDNGSFRKAVNLIGGVEDLNKPQRKVVVKVGIYNVVTGICTTSDTLNLIISLFDNATEVLVTESDSNAGPGLERLKIWEDCYNDRVVPFNLSHEDETTEVMIAGELVPFSNVLLEEVTFISTHVPRRYEEAGNESLMNLGSIIKNLLGLVPDKRKHRFHDRLPSALNDMYEAIGGIDLAVLDGTRTFLGLEKKKRTVPTGLLIVGRDAFAVEAIGAYMIGFDPTEMPVLQEARDRGLGVIDVDEIDIVGDIESPREMILETFREMNKRGKS